MIESYNLVLNRINEMNKKLQENFENKEKELLDYYKKEMLNTQSNLKTLSETTSESVIRKKLQDK